MSLRLCVLFGNPCGTIVASSSGAVTMVKLTSARLAVLVQSFPAVGHLSLGALVFGQFLRDQPFSFWLAVAGFGIWLELVSVAIVIAGDKQ